MNRWPVTIFALSVAIAAATVAIDVVADHATTTTIGLVVPFVVMSGVGGVIVRRRAGNGVGLLLLFVGCFGTVWLAADAYMQFAAEQPTLPPGAHAAAWYASWVWAPLWMSITFLLLIFPTGRSIGPWRWAARVLLGVWGASIVVLAAALIPVPFATLVENASTSDSGNIGIYEWFDETVAPTFFLLGVPLGLASQVVRWKRAEAVERQQVKWLMFAAVMILAAVVAGDLFGSTSRMSELFWTAGLTALPVAVGFAVVRYHLYDIDRIIGRTISYAVVLGILTLVFMGLVGVPVVMLGSAEAPAWLVAASTLTVFTLFNPLRRRVQRVVDRRFNRLPYDPEAVHRALAESLRDEVTAPAISAAWERHARSALQPVSAGVWMRGRG